MRPEILSLIFRNISSIVGIGPKLENLFFKLLNDRKIVNLLWHLPYNNIKREISKKINEDIIGKNIVIKIKVIKHIPSIYKKQPYKIICSFDKIEIYLIFFNARHPYLKEKLPINSYKYVSGKIEFFRNNYQITHPEYIVNDDQLNSIDRISPIYSLTAGLTNKVFTKTMKNIIKNLPELNEWLSKKTLQKYKFLSWKESLLKLHSPKNELDLINFNNFRKRIAYDELLAHQLAILIIRNMNRKKRGIKFKTSSVDIDKFINELPFELTKSQLTAIAEISKNLSNNFQMVRLLQGDVGSGKTIISIISMIIAFKSNYQSAIMVPTEILANQHFETIKSFLKNFKINIDILTSKDRGKKRHDKINNIANGNTKIIVGTHSLIQEDVKFYKLGLIIIDEQHRFGVHQRLAFTHKGLKPNILVMTATPIPRTLTLAIYGDMDESRITEKPKGRIPIITTSLLRNKINNLINAINAKIEKNEKIYWVCPLIEESNDIDAKAAVDRFNSLKKLYKNKVLLLHGQMKSDEKDEIMNKFKYKNYNILVSTTVIEVGIDIPSATTLIIENSEKFGLAQLHQLRGRIGRSNIESNCILLYKNSIGEIAKRRINIMKKIDDGFEIAEQDLKIRGPGEILGKKQSGIASFKVSDLHFDQDILQDVRKDSIKIIEEDPDFKSDRGKKLKTLLYLFERDIAIKTLISG
ncbi:MAG: ATP-dependent DNA helicase RecG [Pelagibacteraceae bacterium]|nr:ATP-dependent DNA helicase RecG [Pelagibacteraceae bacterium]|tara:strand:+ start:318 stop:2402 length:2085 start_codon:yes stop_codon:yes gene_type:complete